MTVMLTGELKIVIALFFYFKLLDLFGSTWNKIDFTAKSNRENPQQRNQHSRCTVVEYIVISFLNFCT